MTNRTPPKTLLVTGASGFLGWNICCRAAGQYQVNGVYHSHPCGEFHGTSVQCNLTSEQDVQKLFSTVQPDAVIHAAAAADPNFCQINPESSHAINVTATENITRQCAALAIPLIFTSTDLVFDGKNAPYSEEAPVNPINRYGEQKVLAEQVILSTYNKATICRMPLMFGDAIVPAKSFIQPIIAMLRNGKELPLFTDEYRTPAGALDAADGLLLCIEKEIHGILHLGGPQRLSRYEIGHLIAAALGTIPNITPILQKTITMATPRPLDAALISTKANALGYHPQTVVDALQFLSCIAKTG